MLTIYKYPLDIGFQGGVTSVSVPVYSIVRHVGSQNGVPMLWMEHDLLENHELRTFHIIGTGHSIPVSKKGENLHYIGTTQTEFGLAWHIYEEK